MVAASCLIALIAGERGEEAETGALLVAELLSIARAWFNANKKR